MLELAPSVVDIPLLVPDMPPAAELLPWLVRIDAARCYTNFGPLLREFESRLARFWDSACAPPEVVGVSSGTAALELGIAALGLPAGARVLLPSFTFPATASAPLRHGLSPLLADVAPETWQLTPELARRATRQHPLALVMPVATFGCPVDVAGWDAFVEETGIPVLIDAAAGFGNQALGQRACVAFSFHATKSFGIGEGGALVTRDRQLAARLRRLSNFGFEARIVRELGFNAKLSEYAAAVGLAQLARRPARLAHRRALWQTYAAALAVLPGVRLQRGFQFGQLPSSLNVCLPVPARGVAAALAEMGIQTRRWYLPPLHRQPAFAAYPCCGPAGGARLPVTEYLDEYALGLPWFAHMTNEQCAAVASALGRVLEGMAYGG